MLPNQYLTEQLQHPLSTAAPNILVWRIYVLCQQATRLYAQLSAENV